MPWWPKESSVTIVISMRDKLVLVFREKWFQIPMPCQYWEIMENANMFPCWNYYTEASNGNDNEVYSRNAVIVLP